MRSIKKVTKNTGTKLSTKVAGFINRNYAVILTVALCVALAGMTCFAADADSLWSTISDLIKKWVTRLGGVVVFVGGIMFALGWKSDDAEQKSKGISTIIAGALVMAIAALTSTFFA